MSPLLELLLLASAVGAVVLVASAALALVGSAIYARWWAWRGDRDE